jgi:hypothetical protein
VIAPTTATPTGFKAVAITCDHDGCPEGFYLYDDPRVSVAVYQLGLLGWQVDGSPWSPTRNLCPNHRETS